ALRRLHVTGRPTSARPISAPVTVEGTVADNVGVDRVDVEIFSRDGGEWWNGTGWQAARVQVQADVVGGVWSYVFDPASTDVQPRSRERRGGAAARSRWARG